ncbi:Complement C1q tumor necrosis factor-related protein 3 [Larimichthys crocea]|nr:Complement C1q tumor necrosis factor-related protein 3 [Larimichthys crocea]
MSQCLPVLLLLALVCLVRSGSAQPVDGQAELKAAQAVLEELQAERRALTRRLNAAETEMKRIKETPKVAFAASLGGNGMVKTTQGNKDLVYRDVLTNVGGAYNAVTGVFTAPVRGVYYIRFTANAPTDFTMSAVLYKNNAQIQLIAHEQPSGEGSDTASNGAALLLEQGDTLKMVAVAQHSDLGQQQPPQHLQRLPAVPHGGRGAEGGRLRLSAEDSSGVTDAAADREPGSQRETGGHREGAEGDQRRTEGGVCGFSWRQRSTEDDDRKQNTGLQRRPDQHRTGVQL